MTILKKSQTLQQLRQGPDRQTQAHSTFALSARCEWPPSSRYRVCGWRAGAGQIQAVSVATRFG